MESAKFSSTELGAFVLVTEFEDESFLNSVSGEVKLNRCSRWGHPVFAIVMYENVEEAQQDMDRIKAELQHEQINVSWLFEPEKASDGESAKDGEGFFLQYRSQHDHSAMEIEVREDGRMRLAAQWWSRAGEKSKEREVFQEAFLSKEGVELVQRLVSEWHQQYEELSDSKSEWPKNGSHSLGQEELEFVINQKRIALSSSMICNDSPYAEMDDMHRLASFLHTIKKLRSVSLCMIGV